MTSPNDTRITSAESITDPQGIVWSLTTVESGSWVQRDGVNTNGRGSVILLHDGVIYIKGRNLNWWTWPWKDIGPVDPAVTTLPLPTITNMTVTPPNLPFGGGSVVVNASVAGAASLTLDGNQVTLPATVVVTASRIFLLVATNATGSAQASVAVSVAPLPTSGEFAVLWDGASGVNANLFNVGALLPWQNRLGDWIDALGVNQGATPFATVTTTAAGPFTIDATTLVRYLKANGRRGMFFKPVGFGSVAMRTLPDVSRRPSLVVDGVVFPCAASTVINQSTANPMVGTVLDVAQALLLDFDLSAVPDNFTSATLNLYRYATSGSFGLKAFATRSPRLFGSGTPTLGLAAKYTKDVGIMADPDVYFSSMFDAVSTAEHFPGTKYYATTTYADDPVLGVPARGLRFPVGSFAPIIQGLWHIWSNKPGAGMKVNPFNGLLLVEDTPSAQYKTLGHPHTPSELYFRYYIKFGHNYHCKPQPKKLPGLAGRYGFWTGNDGFGHYNITAGNGGGKTFGTLDPNNHPAEGGSFSGWSLRHHAYNAPADANPYRHLIPIEYYAYHVGMAGSFGDLWRWGNPTDGFANLEPERWYCLEHYAKVNDVVGPFDAAGNGTGVANGIVRGWLDGVLMHDRTNVVLRKHPAIKIDEVWMDFFHGGTTPAEAVHDLQIAAGVVARSYIGPMS